MEQVWDKEPSRRASDPDGAITAARTLLEPPCKHILDDLSISYPADPADADLPALYRLLSKNLDLAPEDEVNETLRRIFGGCASIVASIGSLRNKVSDAHGQGSTVSIATDHYAALAVNLSGAFAAFLCAAWDEARKAPFQAKRWWPRRQGEMPDLTYAPPGSWSEQSNRTLRTREAEALRTTAAYIRLHVWNLCGRTANALNDPAAVNHGRVRPSPNVALG